MKTSTSSCLSWGLPNSIDWQTSHQLRPKETRCLDPGGSVSVLIPLKLNQRQPPLSPVFEIDPLSSLTWLYCESGPCSKAKVVVIIDTVTRPLTKTSWGSPATRLPALQAQWGEVPTNTTRQDSPILLRGTQPRSGFLPVKVGTSQLTKHSSSRPQIGTLRHLISFQTSSWAAYKPMPQTNHAQTHCLSSGTTRYEVLPGGTLQNFYNLHLNYGFKILRLLIYIISCELSRNHLIIGK